jgi:hypothetical protein
MTITAIETGNMLNFFPEKVYIVAVKTVGLTKRVLRQLTWRSFLNRRFKPCDRRNFGSFETARNVHSGG